VIYYKEPSTSKTFIRQELFFCNGTTVELEHRSALSGNWNQIEPKSPGRKNNVFEDIYLRTRIIIHEDNICQPWASAVGGRGRGQAHSWIFIHGNFCSFQSFLLFFGLLFRWPPWKFFCRRPWCQHPICNTPCLKSRMTTNIYRRLSKYRWIFFKYLYRFQKKKKNFTGRSLVYSNIQWRN